MQAAQLDMFSAPVVASPVVEADPLVERLIETGLAHNEFLLTVINTSIATARDDLPSRMFQFPVEFVERDRREDGRSTILLNHPDLASYSFVDEIETKVGFRPAWEPLDEYGRDRGEKWRYYHAIDLSTDEHWRGLIETRNFTDNQAIAQALCYRADYGGLSIANMRSILAEVGSEEPSDRSESYLHSGRVTITNCQQGEFVGFHRRDHHAVWAAIHGLETKRFKRDRNGHLRFTPDFLAQKQAEAIGDVT